MAKRVENAKQWLVRNLPWLVPAGAITYGLVEGARLLEIPDEAAWAANPLPAGVLALFVLTSIGGVYLLDRKAQSAGQDRDAAQKLVERRDRIEVLNEACRHLLVLAHEEARVGRAQLSPLTLSVHAWAVPPSGSGLEHVTRFSIHGRGRTDIDWTRGKGAVGWCWVHELERAFDTEPLQAVAANEWLGLDHDSRLGMSYDEFNKVRAYRGIFVAPLKNTDGLLIGCVSVDSTAPRSGDLLGRLVGSPPVGSAVAVVSGALERVLLSERRERVSESE